MISGTDDIFRNAQQVMVTQESDCLEYFLCGCCGIEAKNSYRISVPAGDEEGDTFLYISEDSGCIERVLCCTNRSLTFKVHLGDSEDGPVLMRMYKPFQKPWCCARRCCARPTMRVYGELPNIRLGMIDNPCHCCYMGQRIFNKDAGVALTSVGWDCQPGFWCPMCCSVNFSIKQDDLTVAKVHKLPVTCGECCVGTNSFRIDFDKVTDPIERRLLLASAMLLDLQYFE